MKFIFAIIKCENIFYQWPKRTSEKFEHPNTKRWNFYFQAAVVMFFLIIKLSTKKLNFLKKHSLFISRRCYLKYERINFSWGEIKESVIDNYVKVTLYWERVRSIWIGPYFSLEINRGIISCIVTSLRRDLLL